MPPAAANLPAANRIPAHRFATRADQVIDAQGRYVMVWFTQLPPDAAGTFQVSVFNVAVRGQG